MGLKYLRRIDPSVRDRFPQQIAFGETFDDMYLSQIRARDDGEGDDINVEETAITYFYKGKPVSTMYGLCGHGYPLFVRSIEGIPVVKQRHDNGTVKQWVEIPYVPDYTWQDSDILKYSCDPPKTYEPAQPYWSQGRVFWNGYLYELYGGPYDKDGPTQTTRPYGPPELRIYKDGELVKTIDVSGCGRVGGKFANPPERGRVEPEGMALTFINDKAVLVLNFAAGRSWGGFDTLCCYQYTYDLD